MGFKQRTRDYVALVDGAFDETGEWFVEVSLIYREMSDPLSRETLIAEAKRALLLGVIEESQRGRALGAEKVRVADKLHIRCAGQHELLDV